VAKHPRATLPKGPKPPPRPRQPRAPKPPKSGGGSLAARAKRDPSVLRRALKNPGLRSKLPSSMLTRQQRGQRAANTRQAAVKVKVKAQNQRLKAPIVPGSGVTEKQLGQDTRAAMDTKYGALESQQRRQTGEAQTWEHDVGGFYDQYLKQIAQQAANVRQIGTEANQQVAGLQAGVSGLAGQDLKDIQAPANEDAKARGMVAGDNTQLASAATATRQGLLGSTGAAQVSQNAAASRYADTMARLVAPGQKLQGVAQAHGRVRQARDSQAATARERGASALSYKAERRSDESRNLLAQATLTGNLASKAATAAGARATRRETKRSHRASEAAARARIRAQPRARTGRPGTRSTPTATPTRTGARCPSPSGAGSSLRTPVARAARAAAAARARAWTCSPPGRWARGSPSSTRSTTTF
jgi:hypothetical protein